MRRRMMVLGIAVCLAAGWSWADPPVGKEALDMAQIVQIAAGGAPTGPAQDAQRFPKFEDVTKDMQSKAGLFTLWSYPESAAEKDKEKLLCQIPKGFLGEKFMLSVSFSGGGFFTGFPLEETVVKLEILDKNLLLIEPESRYVIDEGQTVSDVVRRTYPERIRSSVAIVTLSPQGDPLLDLGTLLKSNFADIAWMSAGGGPFPGMGGGGVNSGLSKWSKKKTFELNVEIGVELAIHRPSPPGSFDKKLVHFSFWKLPKSDYQPRIADDRVGYFITANQDWAKPTDARDIFNRYIDRWHLVKRDPSLAKCEPKQPITFYIEKTVPVRFRRAVRDGILEWNKAFEKIGFVNAVEVRQQTEDNEWKDLDPEDMRFSFFRWVVTGASFAMGPHRGNPFTGQIYDADIIFDDSMVRYLEREIQENLSTSILAARLREPGAREFFDRYPQFHRPATEWAGVSTESDAAQEVLRQRMSERLLKRGHFGCDYADGMKHQVALGYAMLAGLSKDVQERFLYDVIKEVVMHEVGHTLGLRHNFKASSIYALDEIKRRRTSGEPTVGSVMDYNAALFVGDKLEEGFFITPTIGPYDEWAIEYGYRPADGSFKGTVKSGGDEAPKDGGEKKDDVAASANAGTDGDSQGDVPKDVLDKLPPEVRKMIEEKQGAVAAMKGKPEAKSGGGPGSAGPNAAEADMLHTIASRSAEPELAYASDEDTTLFGPDPRSNRFDMAADPVDWANARLELINARIKGLLDWSVKDRESWYYLRRSFIMLVFEKAQVMDYVGRYIGGQYTNRAHRGDPNAPSPFEPVDPELQRKSLAFIEDNMFRDEYFTFSPEMLNHLAAARWWHMGTGIDFVVDFPVHDFIGVLQWFQIFDRLFPNTLRRIHDAELKTSAANRLTAAEYLQRMHKAVWGDTFERLKSAKGTCSDASPCTTSIRRSLQREYLNMVEPLVRIPPGQVLSPDLHAMVQNSARRLGEQLSDAVKTGGLDFATEAHLVSCKSRIERMLAPELNEFGFQMR